ncbi:hypothetical protein HanRHA438_Chr08g0370551 [Helianthus annuus]|nr:hypothetical protein HanRHA438_Chr08g0370551 [Helianthus annuus]
MCPITHSIHPPYVNDGNDYFGMTQFVLLFCLCFVHDINICIVCHISTCCYPLLLDITQTN